MQQPDITLNLYLKIHIYDLVIKPTRGQNQAAAKNSSDLCLADTGARLELDLNHSSFGK